MKLTVEEIVSAVSGTLIGNYPFKEIEEIITDSRKTTEKSLFVALKGESFDGHDFLEDVNKSGCRIALVQKEPSHHFEGAVVLTKDTKKALGDIAAYYIQKKNIKRIAVTGSVGKTTTKDMIACVCEKITDTLKTNGNFNNDIGVPLTAFRLENEKAGIFEMGMNHFGEIEYLSKIVKPQIGVITNIGYSHLENLGSREGILKAKMEILKYMDKDSVIILNGDNELLFGEKDKIEIKTMYIGINNPECDLIAQDIREEGGKVYFSVSREGYELEIPGIHNVYNALFAIAVGKLMGGDYKTIKEALMKYKPGGIRQNIINHNGFTIILDCYNASPDSMIASLDVLSKIEGKRKIAVLGSVAELGDERDALLYEVGRKIKEYGINELITVSGDALAINKGAQDSGVENICNFGTNREALKYLEETVKEGDALLIKGSRKYKMEEISEGLLNTENA